MNPHPPGLLVAVREPARACRTPQPAPRNGAPARELARRPLDVTYWACWVATVAGLTMLVLSLVGVIHG